MLRHHPMSGRFLRVPGLEQLFGQAAQLVRIYSCINSTIESLDLKLLTNTEFNLLVHRHFGLELEGK